LTDKQFGDDIVLPTGHDIYRVRRDYYYFHILIYSKYNHITGQRDYLLRDIGYNPTCMASGYDFIIKHIISLFISKLDLVIGQQEDNMVI
jgi:hypothetical protein